MPIKTTHLVASKKANWSLAPSPNGQSKVCTISIDEQDYLDDDPVEQTHCQVSNAGTRIILTIHLIVAFQYPIEVFGTPDACFNPQVSMPKRNVQKNAVKMPTFSRRPCLLKSFDQATQGFVKLGFIIEQPLHFGFSV